ncbi:acetylornithine transaminase [Ligilactobacillus equi]|nr:acetylornithine transaminase [Ligilactobacillus equi]
MFMQHIFPTYNRFPFEIVAGDGYTLSDQNGKNYLDFTSGIGVCNLGYNHPILNQAVAQQLNQVWHTSNLYNSQLQEAVATMLVPDESYLVSFCNSGTEANEAALKLARKSSGKQTILAFDHSFHGRSYGSLSVTGNSAIKVGFGEMLPGVIYAQFNNSAALDLITPDLAAVMLEVIQGEGGVNVADADWLQAVAAKCQESGVLLIVDEVQTGMGRTGSKYAFQQFGIEPDIFTLAKGLANGIPVGAMVGKAKLASAFGPGSHGSTFAGNPLAMAAAKEVLQIMDQDFLACVHEKGHFFSTYLQDKLTQLDCVTDITGLGMIQGIHLKETVPVGQVILDLQAARLLTISAKNNTLRLLPPLTMPASKLMAGCDLIQETLVNYAKKGTANE